MVYGPNLKKNTKSRKLIIVTILAILAVALVGFFGYRWWHQRKLIQAQQQSPNPQTELGNDTKTDESSTNTSKQNQQLSNPDASTSPNSSSALPTPLLAKSSGNNGSVPVGANIEFTCRSAAGYDCLIQLTGPKDIKLESKKLVDDGRGGTGVSWIWPAEKGSWQVVAIISDAQGAQKNSAAQALEVK